MANMERPTRAAKVGGGGSSSDDPLLVHIHISRTGGSTLNHVLRSSYGARHCPVEPWESRWGGSPFSAHDLRRLRKVYPDLKSVAGHRIFGYVDLEEKATDLRYFALMRDPIKACASRFQGKARRSGKTLNEFEDWIQKDWTRNRHTKSISGNDDVADAIRLIAEKNIFIGLTERFDESLLLLKRLVAPDLDISYKPTNVARDKTIAQRLLSNERTVQMLAESQEADLELYRYVKQELYPEYMRNYGSRLAEDVVIYRETRRNHFNRRNVVISRVKAYSVYKPALYLHRKRVKVV